MEEQNSEQFTPPVEHLATNKRSSLTLVKVVAFVAVVVLLEIAAAAMLMPGAAETERLAEELAAASQGMSVAATKHDTHEENYDRTDDVREVKLGAYNITRFNPANNMTRVIDFELFGTVLAEDLPDFEHLFDNSQARVREQVIMTLHGAESTDLTDAGLGLLKRRILEKTNRALGQPVIREVLFSKFNFVER